MKKICFLVFIIISGNTFSQIYTPTGIIQGTSGNDNVGIGTNNPLHKLNVYGTHVDSRILLHSNGRGDDAGQANLLLWAIEPGLTYTVVGISNNISNYTTSNGLLKLLNPARGGSYIRLLENSMLFNVVSISGIDTQAISIKENGNVGIGTTTPDSKLAVNGIIHSKEVKVDFTSWPDYVFKKEYHLPTLEEVEKHIVEKGHLENIPNQEKVLKNGLNLGEMNAMLLQKVEELTLYSIDQNKKIDAHAKEIAELKNLALRIAKIENELSHK